MLGGSHHVEGATARHDRVAWAFASVASQRGVDLFQHTPVTAIVRDGDRVVGVETPRGRIAAGAVLSAAGGRVTQVAAMAGVRLPVRTHPLHAFVTNDYAQGFPIILASTELACYVSQTERGQMLIGAEFDAQPSYSRQSSFAALRSYTYKITRLLPFLQPMRILRQWAGICDISVDFSPIMSATPVDGFYVTTGWGTWGFKAIPAGGEGMAELIATGTAAGAHRAVHPGPVRARPRAGRRRLGGDALMPTLDCPRCGRRPLDEYVFGGERRTAPSSIEDADARDFDEVWIFDNPDGDDDRALVPRVRLPALADRPPRHERATSSWRCAEPMTTLADRALELHLRGRVRFGVGAIGVAAGARRARPAASAPSS